MRRFLSAPACGADNTRGDLSPQRGAPARETDWTGALALPTVEAPEPISSFGYGTIRNTSPVPIEMLRFET